MSILYRQAGYMYEVTPFVSQRDATHDMQVL